MTAAASPLWDVPRQQQATAVLRGACARDEVGHAWAFVGPAGVGQEEVARALAAALNCPTPLSPGEPCGQCSVCDRCLRGAFAAYLEFVPTGVAHRVDDVRQRWLHEASRSAVEGRWKVLRICDADRMNEAAANAFLKGLEEPGERTTWILDVADPDELPDTILSRCRALRFAPWGRDALAAEAERLGMADGADLTLAVRAAHGSPVGLRRLARDGGLERLRQHRDILRRLREEGPRHALVAAHVIGEEVSEEVKATETAARAERDDLAVRYADEIPRRVVTELEERTKRRQREAKIAVVQHALDDVLGWIRDCLLVSAGGDPAHAIHADAPGALRADAEALRPRGLLRAADLVTDAREALERNVQPGLALEALFMELSALLLSSARR